MPPNVTYSTAVQPSFAEPCFREFFWFPNFDIYSFTCLNCCLIHEVQRIKNTDGFIMKKCPSQAPPYQLCPSCQPCAMDPCPCPAAAVWPGLTCGTRGALVARRHSALVACGPRFSPQDTVSVHRPSFYAERFFKFMSNTVFRKNSCELPRPSGQEGPGGAERGGGVAKSGVNPEPLLLPRGHPWASVRVLVQRTGESGCHCLGAQHGA